MIYAGIDVAKDKHDCLIVDSDGVVLFDLFTIQNNITAFDELFQKAMPSVYGAIIGCCQNASLPAQNIGKLPRSNTIFQRIHYTTKKSVPQVGIRGSSRFLAQHSRFLYDFSIYRGVLYELGTYRKGC